MRDMIRWTRLANFPDLSGSSNKTLRFKDSALLINKSGYLNFLCSFEKTAGMHSAFLAE
jgi:hypothetical protein